MERRIMRTQRVSLRQPQGFGSQLKTFLFSDLKTKAIALVCAAMVWYLISGQIATQRTMVIPIEVASVDQDHIMVETRFRSLEVVLEGPRLRLAPLSEEKLVRRFTVDPERLEAGETSKVLEVRAEDLLSIPAESRVLEVNPSRIQILVKKVHRRNLVIQANLEGQLKKGYKVSSVTFKPTEVEALVPVELAEKAHIRTQPIQVGQRDKSFSVSVNILAEIDGQKVYPLSNRPIVARVEIEELADERELTLDVLILRPPGYSVRVKEIDPTRINVLVVGPQVAALEPHRFRAYIDLRDLKPEEILEAPNFPHHLDLRIETPPGFRFIEAYVTGGNDQKQVISKVNVLFVES